MTTTTTTAQAFVDEMQGLAGGSIDGSAASMSPASGSEEHQTVVAITTQDSGVQVNTQTTGCNSPQAVAESIIVSEAQEVKISNSSPTTTAIVQPSIVSTSSGAPHFIAVAVSDTGERSEQEQVVQEAVALQAGQGGSTMHPTYVQYVDQGTTNISDPAAAAAATNIYAASNGQMTYSVYSVSEGGSMYTPASASYYNATGTTAVTHSPVGGAMTSHAASVIGSPASLQGQILTTAHGNAYVVQGITGSLDGEAGQLAHATRASPATDGTITYLVPGSAVHTQQNATDSCAADQADGVTIGGSGNGGIASASGQSGLAAHATRVSPATVQWLLDNYETAEGVSLPRRTLYQHYCRHCSDNKLEPINAASFGKLIRSVFLGLRTRRLGTRGNSKYHYYGLRVKPDSPLVHMSEDHGSAALRQQPLGNQKRLKVCTSRVDQNGSSPLLSSQQQSSSSSSNDPTSPPSAQMSQTHQIQSMPQQQQHQQYLGDSSTAVPHCINIDFTNNHLPEGVTIENITTFVEMYRDHCESFLDVVTNLQFSMVEMLWQTFWRCQISQGLGGELDSRMSKSQLYSLCKCDAIQEYVRRTDYQFYQNLVDVLIPDVLRPIPSSLTQAIRNFAKSLEGWLASSMTDCPDDIVTVKVSAVSAFAQTLRRYTSLNHLAQAARAVLQNSAQIHQMLADLNRVDFHNVQEQASWVCQCDDLIVQKLEEDFKATLQQQNSLEQWATWLEGVVNQVLRPYEGKLEFPKAARQFLLKWSFYSSMVIRDLTLRSAASFGSFHLIRLLYDEYMFYLIEHRVAEATGETPIAVMGEFIGLGTRPTAANKGGLSYSGACSLSLVTNHSVNFSHQLCSERSTDSESSTSSSTTGRTSNAAAASSSGTATDVIDIPMKRIKPSPSSL